MQQQLQNGVPAPSAGQPPTDAGLIQNQMQQRLNQLRQQQQAQGQAAQGTNEDADINELQAVQKRINDQYGALNAVNPMSADSTSAGTGGLGAPRARDAPVQVQTFQSIADDWMKKPWFRQLADSLMKTSTDPEFTKALAEMSKSKNLKFMYLGIFLWTAMCWFLKRRVLAATDRTLPRLMIRGGMYVVYLGGYFLVSYSMLGPPVVKVLDAVLPAFWTAIKSALLGSPK